MIMPSRRFAGVPANSLGFLVRRFLRRLVRGFAAVSGKPLKSLVRRFRGGCGAYVPHTPYALRGAFGARRGRISRRGMAFPRTGRTLSRARPPSFVPLAAHD
jgi:hypothetical protein